MNFKSIGEKAECVVIGELAKWCIDVALPTSDNHQFDLIIIVGGKLFKVQIKSTSIVNSNSCIKFDLTTNEVRYSKNDCDAILCYEWNNNYLYVLSPAEFENKKNFTIRTEQPKNNTSISTCHFHKDYIICEERIEKVFGVKTENISKHLYGKKDKIYQLVCMSCGKSFEDSRSWLKYCCKEHRISRSKVKPPFEELENLIKLKTPWVRIGKKYGVTDNAVRKWARGYGLL